MKLIVRCLQSRTDVSYNFPLRCSYFQTIPLVIKYCQAENRSIIKNDPTDSAAHKMLIMVQEFYLILFEQLDLR